MLDHKTLTYNIKGKALNFIKFERMTGRLMELTYAEGEKHSSWVTLMSHVRMVEVPVKVNMSWALSPASACISRYTEIFYIYSTLHYIES